MLYVRDTLAIEDTAPAISCANLAFTDIGKIICHACTQGRACHIQKFQTEILDLTKITYEIPCFQKEIGLQSYRY